MIVRRHWLLIGWIGLWLAHPLAGAESPARKPIPPAFGPHIGPALNHQAFQGARSWTRRDRVVGTYYFYWYDDTTGRHLVDPDGSDALTTHPPTLKGFSYKSVDWHRQQLEDMMAAGIDFVLPVFWGAPSEHVPGSPMHWSYEGLPPLVAAREALLKEGRHPPHIGLFYDTSTLRHNRWGYHADLTTDYGRHWFYATIRDFFSMIPPRHWAMVEDRPIVLLYAASFARRHDQTVVQYARRAFARDFAGRRLWLVPEVSWQVKADSVVAWGGALGLRNPGVASLGPGYDHAAVPGRQPLVVPRRDGQFYEDNWKRLLRRPSPMVIVETWNEFHEGTDVAESKEYGRRYIELTRRYVDLFKAGHVAPWPRGRYSGSETVSLVLGEADKADGLKRIEQPDGQTRPIRIRGREGRTLVTGPERVPVGYLYYEVDDTFKSNGATDYELEVVFFDGVPCRLGLQYDGTDATAPFRGAYTTSAHTEILTGDGRWRQVRFPLRRAVLNHGQNGGADLRLVIQGATGLAVEKLTLRRLESK